MADTDVDDLIRRINRLVEQDTGGVSRAEGDQLPWLSYEYELRTDLERLATNVDRPTGLLPSPGEPDLRSADLRAFVHLVSDCAEDLAPEHPPTEDRLSLRFSRGASLAYAHLAGPRLLAKLLPEGGAEVLGQFPQPPHAGDLTAARTVAIGISGRTGEPEGAVLTEMVAAGRGEAGRAAADMLLRTRPGLAELSPPDRAAVVEVVATELENKFPEGATMVRLQPVMHQQRAKAATRGADAVDHASEVGDREIKARQPRNSVGHILNPQLTPAPGSGASPTGPATDPGRTAAPGLTAGPGAKAGVQPQRSSTDLDR